MSECGLHLWPHSDPCPYCDHNWPAFTPTFTGHSSIAIETLQSQVAGLEARIKELEEKTKVSSEPVLQGICCPAAAGTLEFTGNIMNEFVCSNCRTRHWLPDADNDVENEE